MDPKTSTRKSFVGVLMSKCLTLYRIELKKQKGPLSEIKKKCIFNVLFKFVQIKFNFGIFCVFHRQNFQKLANFVFNFFVMFFTLYLNRFHIIFLY